MALGDIGKYYPPSDMKFKNMDSMIIVRESADRVRQAGGRLSIGADIALAAEVGTDAAHVFGGLLATLTAWCEHQHIAYRGVPVGTIKRHATGRGHASKALVLDAMRTLGHPVTDANEADALALLHWAIDEGDV